MKCSHLHFLATVMCHSSVMINPGSRNVLFPQVFGHSIIKCLTKAQGLWVTHSALRLSSALCLLPGVQVCIPCPAGCCSIQRQPQSTFEWRIGILYFMQKYRNLSYSLSVAESLYASISPLERYITSLPLPFSRGQQRSLKEFSQAFYPFQV